MIIKSMGGDAPARVLLEPSEVGLAVRRRLELVRGEPAKIELMASAPQPGQRPTVDTARALGSHLLLHGDDLATGCTRVSIAASYALATEKKRRERPFLSITPEAFLFRSDDSPERIANFIIAYFALERGMTGPALELVAGHKSAPFLWLAGAAHLWSGSYLAAFNTLNQITPPEDDHPLENSLFKAAMATASASLLEASRAQGPSGAPVTAEQVKPLLLGLLDETDPSREPELAGMLLYNLGLAESSGSVEASERWFRGALEISPQISVYAEAAAAAQLASLLYRATVESEQDRESRLSEAESLLQRALIVYTPDGSAAGWLSAQALLGQVLLDLSEYGESKRRVNVLTRSVEAFSQVAEAVENGEEENLWAGAMMGLCAALTALAAAVGGARGLGLLEQALAMLDVAEPRMPMAGEKIQLNRAAAVMVQRQIEKSMGGH
ncbi:MAG: hypothetical protein OEV92_02645 [Nitrospinota bacterium]|nr:hypothetical protein [Nitrospinota bacterium]